jgi:hypothetical protein
MPDATIEIRGTTTTVPLDDDGMLRVTLESSATTETMVTIRIPAVEEAGG